MDCEKFESAMLGELYGELDELTSASAKRHIAGCARCSALVDGLRATRLVAAVPLLEPASDLEERILRATDPASMAPAPLPHLARIISLAGSWAMRPQTAMAAVFLVMIGTSLLLLRSQSARAPAGAEVTVTEQGTPAPAPSAPVVTAPVEPVRPRATAPTPPTAAEAKAAAVSSTRDALSAFGGLAGAPAARAFAEAPPLGQPLDQKQPSDEQFDAALRSYRAGRFREAAHSFDALAATDPNAPDLWAARAVRDGSGCRAAVARFDKTAQRHKQAPTGWDALLEGALCYRALGDFGTARARLNALLGVDSHKDRARAEIDRIDELQQAQASGAGGDAHAAAKASKVRASAAVAAEVAVAPAGAAQPPAMPAAGAASPSEAPDSNH